MSGWPARRCVITGLFTGSTAIIFTPGFRFYDTDADRAQALDPVRIEVKGDDGKEVKGVMEVRFSYLPATFGSLDKRKQAVGKNQNARFHVMKEYNGILFYRMSCSTNSQIL